MCQFGHLKMDINAADVYGDTALSEAASGGHTDVLSFLLNKGAEMNVQGRFSRTPLYRAAFAGQFSPLILSKTITFK